MKRLPLSLLALVLAQAVQAGGFTALDRQGARALTDPGQHRQPTIVALWSSDCVHCKKNLALFAAMAKADRRLRVITVATEPDSPALGPLLDKNGIDGTRYAYGSDNPEAIAYALDPNWAGELPRTLFYDGRGRQTKVSGVIKPDDALRAVTPH